MRICLAIVPIIIPIAPLFPGVGRPGLSESDDAPDDFRDILVVIERLKAASADTDSKDRHGIAGMAGGGEAKAGLTVEVTEYVYRKGIEAGI